jgi:hypothetical protein
MKGVLATICLALVCTGCSYPAGQVVVTDERPRITFTNVPEGAEVYVDGLAMGSAVQLEKENQALGLEAGTHRVQLRGPDGEVLFTEKVFLGSGTLKVFALPAAE